MEYSTIEYEMIENGLGVLTLNRPRKYNAVNFAMMDELEDFWRERRRDLKTHVIVLRGNGEKGFCSGLDMHDAMDRITKMNAEQFYAFQSRLARLVLAMRRAPQPIVCAVHGPAVGLGFSFALASDIRIIGQNARFCAAFINIGLGGADMACSYLLPRTIGTGRAHELMLTGEFLSAGEAERLGMVTKVVEEGELFSSAISMAKKINEKNPMGLRLTKEAINFSIDANGLEQVLQIEDRNQALLVLRAMSGKSKKTSRYF